MRIGLTFNLKPPEAQGDQFEEFDSEETISALEGAIRASGHEPVRLGWGEEMLDRLPGIDGVFNLAEGMGGRGRESQVPATLEMLGIPCSASSALSIGLTLDKALAKMVAKAHAIPTAPFQVSFRAAQTARNPPPETGLAGRGSLAVSAARDDRELRYPLFAKPCNEGSSMGITAASRCENEEQLRVAIDRLQKYGPVLIEEFLPGDEFTVAIIDGRVIGTMQVVPRQEEPNFIYSLEVKRDYLNRVEYVRARQADVEQVAMDVWRAFDLRDVARVDIRRDRDGIPNFVEVNPLPGMNPVTSDLVIIGRLFEIEYNDLIGRVISSATRRWSSCAS
jgi:D-alanine-D-alanine ligase